MMISYAELVIATIIVGILGSLAWITVQQTFFKIQQIFLTKKHNIENVERFKKIVEMNKMLWFAGQDDQWKMLKVFKDQHQGQGNALTEFVLWHNYVDQMQERFVWLEENKLTHRDYSFLCNDFVGVWIRFTDDRMATMFRLTFDELPSFWEDIE